MSGRICRRDAPNGVNSGPISHNSPDLGDCGPIFPLAGSAPVSELSLNSRRARIYPPVETYYDPTHFSL